MARSVSAARKPEQSGRMAMQPSNKDKLVYLELENGARIPLQDVSSKNSNHIVYEVDPTFKSTLEIVHEATQPDEVLTADPIDNFRAPDAMVRSRAVVDPIAFTRWSPFSGSARPEIADSGILPGLGAHNLPQQPREETFANRRQSQHATLSPILPVAHERAVPSPIAQRLIARAQGTELPLGVRSLPPSGVVPNPNKKEFCSHWIRHGECNFTQQGCVFKHVMPDLTKLREIGFRQVPEWYRERESRAALAAEPRRSGAHRLTLQNSKYAPESGEGPRMRASPAALRTIMHGITQTSRHDKSASLRSKVTLIKAATPPPSGTHDSASSPTSDHSNSSGHEQSLIDLEMNEAEVAAIASHHPLNGVDPARLSSEYIHVAYPITAARRGLHEPPRPSSVSSNESKSRRYPSPARNHPGVIGQPRRGARATRSQAKSSSVKESSRTRSGARH